jgi:small-conductance mechanosensitive channel
MTPLFHDIAAIPLTAKLLAAIIGVVIIHNAFRFLEHRLLPHFGYGGERYRVRKLVGLAAYLFVFAYLMILFEDRIRQFGFATGLLGAGVVVALQDMIASIAGWFVISFNSLFKVGDRIQIDQTRGDVVDISTLRTTLLETGNWVSGDLFNGRNPRMDGKPPCLKLGGLPATSSHQSTSSVLLVLQRRLGRLGVSEAFPSKPLLRPGHAR